MNEREQLVAGERAEAAGDYVAAESAFRAVTASASDALAAEAHFHLGRLRWRQGRFDASLATFEIARAMSERIGETELLARVENGIGAVHYARGDYDRARRAYGAAQARTADRAMRGKIILNLGVIENIEGNLLGARMQYDRALALLEQSGDQVSVMFALHNRGMVEADLEEWDAAGASFDAALAIANDLGHVETLARTLVNRSEVLLRRGAVRETIADCERALQIYSQVGDEVGRGEALRWYARALARNGQHAAAERSAGEAVHIAMRAGAKLLEAEATRELAAVRGLLGDTGGWAKGLQRALALFTELGARRQVAEVETQLAEGPPHAGKGKPGRTAAG